jgi:hypothetical protein
MQAVLTEALCSRAAWLAHSMRNECPKSWMQCSLQSAILRCHTCLRQAVQAVDTKCWQVATFWILAAAMPRC